MATHSAPPAPQGPGEHVLAAPTSGAEGARRVLAVLQAFSPQHHTLTARELAEVTTIPLPSMYRYIALLRDTGLLKRPYSVPVANAKVIKPVNASSVATKLANLPTGNIPP